MFSSSFVQTKSTDFICIHRRVSYMIISFHNFIIRIAFATVQPHILLTTWSAMVGLYTSDKYDLSAYSDNTWHFRICIIANDVAHFHMNCICLHFHHSSLCYAISSATPLSRATVKVKSLIDRRWRWVLDIFECNPETSLSLRALDRNSAKLQVEANFFSLTTNSDTLSLSPCDAVQNLYLSAITMGAGL